MAANGCFEKFSAVFNPHHSAYTRQPGAGQLLRPEQKILHESEPIKNIGPVGMRAVYEINMSELVFICKQMPDG
jgi:hypothetical protein